MSRERRWREERRGGMDLGAKREVGGKRQTVEVEKTHSEGRDRQRTDSRTTSGEMETPQIRLDWYSSETMRVGTTERDWARRRVTSSWCWSMRVRKKLSMSSESTTVYEASKRRKRERAVSAGRRTSKKRVEGDATNLVWCSERMRIPEIPAERFDEWYPHRISSRRRVLGARVDNVVREGK